MAHRYFIDTLQGDTAVITGGDAVHLGRVLRVAPGDILTLCDGAGFDYEAEVVQVQPEQINLKIISKYTSFSEPTLHITCCIGFAKGERMDWAVQKAVELGACAIVPFFSEHTVVKPKNNAEKRARFARIALEAAKQSGRGLVPTVAEPEDFAAVLTRAKAASRALFFYEEGGRPLPEVVGDEPDILLITGAEGGFSLREAALAKEAGCVTVGLGPRILRSETAVAATLAAVLALRGELQ